MNKFSSWFHTHTAGALASFKCNVVYWIRHRKDWWATQRRIKHLRQVVLIMSDAEHTMVFFKPRTDGPEWTPWLSTAVHRFCITREPDGPAGAAVLWRFLFGCAEHPAEIWHLHGKRNHRIIALTRGHVFLGENNSLYEVEDPWDWHEEVLGNCDFMHR